MAMPFITWCLYVITAGKTLGGELPLHSPVWHQHGGLLEHGLGDWVGLVVAEPRLNFLCMLLELILTATHLIE